MATITFHDNADERYNEHSFELFRARWALELGKWVRDDKNGTEWAIDAPGEGVHPFFKSPEEFGTVEYDDEDSLVYYKYDDDSNPNWYSIFAEKSYFNGCLLKQSTCEEIVISLKKAHPSLIFMITKKVVVTPSN